MSGFQIGDVVQCVRMPKGPIDEPWEPKVGSYYTVFDLDEEIDTDLPLLVLEEDPYRDGEGAFEAAAFRKIEAPQTEVSDMIRACKPHRVSA